MGEFLSVPNKEKVSEDKEEGNVNQLYLIIFYLK
jgi:hypothetical protein